MYSIFSWNFADCTEVVVVFDFGADSLLFTSAPTSRLLRRPWPAGSNMSKQYSCGKIIRNILLYVRFLTGTEVTIKDGNRVHQKWTLFWNKTSRTLTWQNFQKLTKFRFQKFCKLTGWQSPTSMQALICEWIHSVDRSFIVLRRKASKSRNTSLCRSLYLAGWWGIMVAKSRFRHL